MFGSNRRTVSHFILAVAVAAGFSAAATGAGAQFTYDRAGRLIRADYGGGVVVNYTYDASGNLLAESVSNPVAVSFPFYQGDAGRFTGYAVSNFSPRSARLDFTAFGPGGEPLPFSTNPTSVTLEAGKQFARLGHEIFGTDAAATQNGWVKMTTDNPDIGSFFQAGSGLQLDGSVAFTRQAKKFYFTRVFEGATAFRGGQASTFLSVTNPNGSPVTVKLNLVGPTNQSLAPEQVRTLAENGFFFESIAQLFGPGVAVSSGYVQVEVTEGDGATGFELIQVGSGNTFIGLNPALGNASNQSYSAQLASGPVVFTNVKLVNTSAQQRVVILTAVAEDGSNLAAPAQVILSPGALYEEDADKIFGFDADVSPVGSIRVQADGGGVVGDVVFGDPISSAFAAALPLQFQTFTKAVFSQVANNSVFFTGLALYNSGTAAAVVTIEVFSDEGTLTGSTSLTLNGGRRLSKLLSELIPAAASQIRGFIVIRSTQPLIAQQLFGTFNLSLMSAVPPTVVH